MPFPPDDDDEIKLRQEKMAEMFKFVPLGVIAALAALLLLKSVTVIPAGHVGVKDLFGKVYPETLSSGFHIVNPLLSVHRLSIRTQETKEVANVPSKEGLTVALEVSVLFSLQPDKAADVYRTIGRNYVSVIVEPTLRSVVRGVTAAYEAKALYTAEREAIGQEMHKQLEPHLTARGVTLEKVLMRSVQLPPILAGAIEKKLEAEQQSQQMQFVLEKERREAERKKIEAQGIADFQSKVSQGLTEAFLRWKGVEATGKLADSQNAKIVVIGSSKDGLPIILGQ